MAFLYLVESDEGNTNSCWQYLPVSLQEYPGFQWESVAKKKRYTGGPLEKLWLSAKKIIFLYTSFPEI